MYSSPLWPNVDQSVLISQIVRSNPFGCTLVLFKQKAKGRLLLQMVHAKPQNLDLCARCERPVAISHITVHRSLSKQVVAIYRQRMQIEEGFRDSEKHEVRAWLRAE